MREIKFRAWDKERKEIFPVKLMDFSQWWVSCDPDYRHNTLEYGERNSFKNEDTDRHILMQYTGLKDKNGKEIYEGDIIACKFHPELHERIDWSNVDIVGAVFWDLCGFSLNARNGEDDRRYPDLVDLNYDESEIIGNIHEHPHLLKEASL